MTIYPSCKTAASPSLLLAILQAGSWVPTPTPKKPPSGPAARLASVVAAPGLIPGGDRDCHLAGAVGAVGDLSPAQSQRLPGLCLLGSFRSQDSGLKIQLEQCGPTPQPSLGQTSLPGKPTGYFFIQVVGKCGTQGRWPLLLQTTVPHSYPSKEPIWSPEQGRWKEALWKPAKQRSALNSRIIF